MEKVHDFLRRINPHRSLKVFVADCDLVTIVVLFRHSDQPSLWRKDSRVVLAPITSSYPMCAGRSAWGAG
jgi:hypothetical protein